MDAPQKSSQAFKELLIQTPEKWPTPQTPDLVDSVGSCDLLTLVISSLKPELCQSAADATVVVYAGIDHIPDRGKIASTAYHRGDNAARTPMATSSKPTKTTPWQGMDLQAQQALHGDGEENRQGGTAGDAAGNEETESKAESSEPTLPPYAPACPLTLPTCGAALMGPQCATRPGPATMKSSIGRECFQDPLWEGGKAFVSEMAKLYQTFAEETRIESFVLTAVIILPHLLLQKPQDLLE